MRSLVPHASSRRAVRLLLGLAAIASALTVVGVVPVLAHDSASGTPDVTITIGSGLSDRDIRVSVGDIVRFVNRDDDRHRMRSRSGQEFDTGNLEPGDSYQVRLSVAGTYSYLDERNDDATAYWGRIVVASGSVEGTAPPAGGSTDGSTGGGAAASATVTIGDDFYDPTSVRIAVGGTVEFRNTGGDEHSATSSAFDTGVLGSGASARKTFPSAGTFAFLCIFHSDMRGTIEVVAPTGGDGGTEPVAPRPTPTPRRHRPCRHRPPTRRRNWSMRPPRWRWTPPISHSVPPRSRSLPAARSRGRIEAWHRIRSRRRTARSTAGCSRAVPLSPKASRPPGRMPTSVRSTRR